MSSKRKRKPKGILQDWFKNALLDDMADDPDHLEKVPKLKEAVAKRQASLKCQQRKSSSNKSRSNATTSSRQIESEDVWGNSHRTSKKSHMVYERSCDLYPIKSKKVYRIEPVTERPPNFVHEELSMINLRSRITAKNAQSNSETNLNSLDLPFCRQVPQRNETENFESINNPTTSSSSTTSHRENEIKNLEPTQYDYTSPSIAEQTDVDDAGDGDDLYEESLESDPSVFYELLVRKSKCFVPIDDHFFTVVVPDFDPEKMALMKRKFVVVQRKCVLGEEDKIRWLYSCTCNPFEKAHIESLSCDTDQVQSETDLCIHVKVARSLINELEVWEENEDPFDTPHPKNDNEISEIPFATGKLLVVVEGTPGVLTYDRRKIFCCVCLNIYCCHCNMMREKRKEENPSEIVADFLLDPPTSVTSVPYKETVSWRKISFDVPNPDTCNPTKFLKQQEGRYICEDSINCRYCGHEVSPLMWEEKILVCKNYSLECKVTTMKCTSCNACLPYDGLDQGILNMEKFLIHHNVMRDYMLHFLHGNSCTIHGYYQVLQTLQAGSGNSSFNKFVSYNNFRCAWYGFLKLLDISLSDNAKCNICGSAPDTVVCDATSLGHQRKFLSLALTDDDDLLSYPRFSHFKHRIAIAEPEIRKSLKRWYEVKMDVRSSRLFQENMRLKHRTIHNIMRWALDIFSKRSKFPVSLKDIFSMLSSSSPVCSYIDPDQRSCDLLLEILKPNIKANSDKMRELQTKHPFFHKLLADLAVESSLPDIWKGLLLDLIDKAQQPFKNYQELRTGSYDTEPGFSSFPNLPTVRKRGNFAQDKVKTKTVECRKNHRGHPNLTSGIFTVYCIHGICIGFQVMDKEESPNIPFTIFRTRFPTAPKYIVYDNACNLHNYALNRDPFFFMNSKFLVDRFHWPNHTACSLGYCMSRYRILDGMNSEVNEQQNSRTKKLKTQLSYMSPENFMRHCELFFWFRNSLCNKKST
ncbi:uncharacterized protein [Clytia hemisphaerica]